MDRLNDSYFEDIEFEREEEKTRIGVRRIINVTFVSNTSTIWLIYRLYRFFLWLGSCQTFCAAERADSSVVRSQAKSDLSRKRNVSTNTLSRKTLN